MSILKPGFRRSSSHAIRALILPALAMVLLLGLSVESAQASVTHTKLSEITVGAGAPEWSAAAPLGVGVDIDPLSASYGNVYVSDYKSGSPGVKVIDKFKEEGGVWKYVCQITGAGSASTSASECNKTVAGPGAFTGTPEQPIVNSSGDVYVPELTGGVVDEFGPTGEYMALGQIKEVVEPMSVASSSSGLVYIANYKEGIVYKYEPTSKTRSTFVSGLGASAVFGVAVDNDLSSPFYGDVYVADDKGKLVEVYNAEGGKLGTITPEGFFTTAETVKGTFGAAYRIAVDPSDGHLYVGDYTDDVVDEFDAAGGFLSDPITGSGTVGSMKPYGLAIGPAGEVYVGDYTNKVVDVFSPDRFVPTPSTGAASSIGSRTATLNGTINPEEGEVTSCSFEYGTSTSPYGHSVPCKVKPGKTIGEEIGTGDSPVAVSAEVSGLEPNTKYNFRLVAGGSGGTAQGANETFTTLSVPVIESASSTNVTDTTARLHATINPEGSQASYHFEYDTREYKTGEGPHGTSVPAPEGAVGAGTSGIAETVELEKLLGETTYYYRVVATNARSEVTDSAGYSFKTESAAPIISQTLASPVGSTTATLTAAITPDYSETTYHFEYGTSESFGSDAPAFNRDIGSGSEPIVVQEPISGLASSTTYYYRVVATNSKETLDGPTRTFTTLLEEGTCPNEKVRAESNVDSATGSRYSAQLPECRGYEQVTPAYKDGAAVRLEPSKAYAGLKTIGVNGSEVLAESPSLWGAPGGDPVEALPSTDALYRIERENGGWTTTPATPLTAEFAYSREEESNFANLAEGIWEAVTPGDPENAGAVYLLQANGTFSEVGPLAPAVATAGEPTHRLFYGQGYSVEDSVIKGSSSEGGVVVVGLQAASSFDGLWPGDETERSGGGPVSLYEYAGVGQAMPILVGVNNFGTQLGQCGTGLGASTLLGRGPTHNGLSENGSRLFFTVARGGCTGTNGAGSGTGAGPSATQVYARVGAPGGPQTTVNVAAATQSQCETIASCDVTSAVTYDGAARNGSKVFFTTSQALLPADTNTSSDIYECQIPGDESPAPAREGTVNACPDLEAVTAAGASEATGVQSVVAINEEGTRVYFIATGALTDTPNTQGQIARSGDDNMYLWEAPSGGDPDGSMRFVATLPTASLAEAESTPRGEYLTFTSSADLTPDDTSSAAQVFRYDAITEELIRISVGDDGFNNDGNTTTNSAKLAVALGEEGHLSISNDGTYVAFQSSDALTPQVEGGINNTYLWHDGNVMLISEGRSTSSGDGLVGISGNGANVFFVSGGALVGQDTDEQTDVYDARIDGGFESPPNPLTCKGEECQGALSQPLTSVIPGSNNRALIGNLVSPGLKPPDEESTTTPTPKPKTKMKTRAEKLKAALKSCSKDKRKSKRKVCEAKARKQYASHPKAKKKPKSKKKK